MLGKKIAVVSVLIGSLFVGMISVAEANQTRRAGQWESTFQLTNTQSFNIDGQDNSSVAVDNDIGWGFSLGYNINAHVLVNFEWMATRPDYKARFINDNGIPKTVDFRMDMYHTQFNGIYHFTRDKFTPYVQAGFGWSYLDSNIGKGEPIGGCWYDPWWGIYRCDYYQNTYNDTRFSYNVAAGVRYELDNGLTLKASYKQLWLDLKGSSATDTGILHFEIGSIF